MSSNGQTRLLLLLLIAGAIVQSGILLFSSIPLGVPGEWVWPRLPEGTVFPFYLGWGIFVLILHYSFLAWGKKQFSQIPLEESSVIKQRALLVGLVLFSAFTLWNLRSVPGNIFGHSGMSWVTYYPRMSGYYTEGVSEDETTTQFLAGYERKVREGDYLHQGTHPPGLILSFRFLHSVCKASPFLTEALISFESIEIKDGLDILEEMSKKRKPPLTKPKRATLSLASLIVVLLCAGTVIPLYFFLVHHVTKETAFAFAGLWPLVPSLILFAPKSDLLLPLFSISLIYFWTTALKNKSIIRGILSGLTLWAGMMISLANIVIPAILIVFFLLNFFFSSENNIKETYFQRLTRMLPVRSVSGLLAGLLTPILLLWLVYDANLFAIWQINLSKHAEFYEHNPRTYFYWLLVNPIELAFSLGTPLFILLCASLIKVISEAIKKQTVSVARLYSGAVAIVWSLLHLSGKNMGEAARLWIFLLPVMLTVSATFFAVSQREELREKRAISFSHSTWTVLFIAQAVAALATVCSVDVFDFLSLIPQ